jgi:hypothetical protein
MGRPAVPDGSPSSDIPECPPASSAQQTWFASGCSVRRRPTSASAASRSATGIATAMNRLRRTSTSALTGEERVYGTAQR